MKKKIKVLFAINCMNIGGAPSVVYEQIKGIDKNKFDPYLLTLYPSKKANFFYKLDFLEKNKIRDFKLKNRSIFDIKTLLEIHQFLKEERFDVVYTHLFLANFLIRPIAIINKVPLIFSFEHSQYFNKRFWQIFSDRLLALFTDKIIVSTESVADFTSKQEKLNINKFTVIPNPISLPNKKDVDLVNLRKKIGIPQNAFCVVSLGRFSIEKGHKYLINAAEKIRNKFPDIFFLLIGHGPLEKYLKDMILSKNLENQFKLVVEPEKAKEFLFAGDVFSLPSLREGQSIVTYEALLAGLPVIASDIDSVREIISDDENGFIIPFEDSDKIVEKIIYLYENKEIRLKMGEIGKKRAEDFIKLKNGVKILENLIEENLDKKNKIKEGWLLPSLFFKKYWFWFSNPVDIECVDMVNFFSYDDVLKEGFSKKIGITSIINLSDDLDNIWTNMRKNFIRKQILRGEKNDILIKKDKNFLEFKKIYLNFRKNKNIPFDNFSFLKKHGTLFSAYHKGEMIAGGIFLEKKPFFRAWVLSSKRLDGLDGKSRDIIGQANRMIIWEAIKTAKKDGYEVFDLGGINPNSTKKEDQSLLEFKESFGGTRQSNYFYHKIYSVLLRKWINLKKV